MRRAAALDEHGLPAVAAPSLAAARVGVELGGRAILRDVDLALHPGEVLGLIGPNGAGKSTLLKALAGDLPLAAGTVTLDGIDLRHLTPLDQARRRAVMPQQSQLRFALTGREVAQLGRSPFERTARRHENEALCDEALELADAREFADRPYPTLSGGEQQRVQLARAIAQILPLEPRTPRYLLLDEPTANLDLAHQQLTLITARALARRGAGVLAVLHDLNLAAQFCNRLAAFVGGRLAAVGGVAQVLTPDTVRRCFGVEVHVLPHPSAACPLIVSRGSSVLQSHLGSAPSLEDE